MPERGRLLISEPHLPDSNFDRTVVLLCDHSEEGSFGFVLNKPSMIKLGDLVNEAQGMELNVNVGGPVEQNTLYFLHRSELIGETETVGHGVYWGGNFKEVITQMEEGLVEENEILFFLGYSGWSAGQLLVEIEQNTWIVSDKYDVDLIFGGHHNEMWKKALKQLGGRYALYAKYPSDPRLN